MSPATLHLLCGKVASGKSTLSARLAKAPRTVVIAEDEWLATLYGEEMSTLRDYARFSALLEQAMAPHILSLLRAGLSVVLDFQANTPTRRAWMRGLIDAAGVAHRLHYLDVPDTVCKARLRARNAAGTHAFAVSEAEFDQIADYFVPPRADEGFTIVRYGPDAADHGT
ncbi:AAA family ATPase [Marimonas sp. MJW-29]|uniref:AAA family ATPase n=1 Tax=Sulfitobacter sediminis TaxID=3234186 RepID=A0ABV3RRS8_9RHOB